MGMKARALTTASGQDREIGMPREASTAAAAETREQVLPILAHKGAEPADPSPLIDLRTLEGIRSIQVPASGDVALEIVQLYRADAARRLKAIRVAFETTDGEALWRTAHALKSSSANVGAVAIEHLCRRLEDVAGQGRTEAASKLVTALERVGPQVLDALLEACGTVRS
jgi:HPt (histidine-containing phosphotransfer) domain-containing protein